MINPLCKQRVFSIQEYFKYEKRGIDKKVIYNIATVTLGLMLYTERVLAAGNVIPVEPGFWKLIGIVQKIVAGLALLYSYRVLAKMAAKGEGTWKEVGYGLLITAADYGLPAAFKFVASLF